jgi:hypothetical protein
LRDADRRSDAAGFFHCHRIGREADVAQIARRYTGEGGVHLVRLADGQTPDERKQAVGHREACLRRGGRGADLLQHVVDVFRGGRIEVGFHRLQPLLVFCRTPDRLRGSLTVVGFGKHHRRPEHASDRVRPPRELCGERLVPPVRLQRLEELRVEPSGVIVVVPESMAQDDHVADGVLLHVRRELGAAGDEVAVPIDLNWLKVKSVDGLHSAPRR